MRVKGVTCVTVLFALGVSAAAQEPSDRFYQTIRNNDLPGLGDLLKSSDANTRDKRETTPLMYAAAVGSLDAMKILIKAGADVNAKNAFDATALMWCATDIEKASLLVSKGASVNARSKGGRTALMIAAGSEGSSKVVKLLLDRGADVTAIDAQRYTALHEALGSNDVESARLLLKKGADVKASASAGMTTLMLASGWGNVEIMRELIARGVDVNAVSADSTDTPVKNGPIALGKFTALLLAAYNGGPEAVKLLLASGADPNAQDVRGMTPLMLALATDRPDVDVVRLLVAKGADPEIKSKDGESARDWARKFNYGPVLHALSMEGDQASIRPVLMPAGAEKLSSPKEAAGKGIALLQRTAFSFFQAGGCGSCHANNLTGVAASVARANGIAVNEMGFNADIKGMTFALSSFEQPLLQRVDLPGGIDIPAFGLLQLSAGKVGAGDRGIDAAIHNMAAQQRQAGNWHFPSVARPPMEDGDFSRTALSIRAFRLYAPAGRKTEFDDRIQRAMIWLRSASPRTTEDRNMQLLGLKWGNAADGLLQRGLKEMMAAQRDDGGWAQTPELPSDAYATGETLYMMHELGVPVTSAEYRRGVEFLLRTQLADGSWHVKSRAPKFQPYFQSGFPHDHDQWISASATAWATMALSFAAGDKQMSAGISSR